MARPTVFVCRGSSCRHHKGYAAVRERLGAVADLAEVRCQHICDGPVVGIAINGTLDWFERMSSDKAQRHFVELLAGSGRMRRSLDKRRIAKRSGKLR